jgi:hypothetical protein
VIEFFFFARHVNDGLIVERFEFAQPIARRALVGFQPVLIGFEFAQGGFGRFDLCGQRGEAVGEAGRARTQIDQLRLDGPSFVDDLREPIGAAFQLGAQLLERGRRTRRR